MSPVPEGTDALTPSTPPPPPLKLRVLGGADAGREILLGAGSTTVGSGAQADFRLGDTSVSRLHLTVELLASGVRASDNGSSNGSFCNGLRFVQIDLAPGAVLRLGRTELAVLPASSPDPGENAGPAFGGLVGKSPAMRALFAKLARLSATDTDVLLTGESGAGKDVAIRALHASSTRAAQPLVICDLAAMSPNLIESELFGHLRGAFTGATQDRVGVFEQAHGGTLFLDEVGELKLELQSRLLRALESRTIRRLGDARDRKLDVRVLAATNRDLEAEVKAGRFREDLYHRLAVVVLTLPPLRERTEDLPLLIADVLETLGAGGDALSPAAFAFLLARPYPGNVRELRNVVEQALRLGETVLFEEARATRGEDGFKSAKETLVRNFEHDYVARLLQQFDGNLTQAAKHAKLDRVSLHRIVKKHGITFKS